LGSKIIIEATAKAIVKRAKTEKNSGANIKGNFEIGAKTPKAAYKSPKKFEYNDTKSTIGKSPVMGPRISLRLKLAW
jgi:hypothetical protein